MLDNCDRQNNAHSPLYPRYPQSFPGSLVVKNLPANAGDAGSIPGSGNHLEKEMTTHSSTLAWKISWTEEPGRLQPMGVTKESDMGLRD